MNLVDFLRARTAEAPDRPALIEGPANRPRITRYAELEERSARLAALFRARGLAGGQTALLFLPMSADLYAVLLGLWRIGATAMFLDPAADAATFARCCAIRAPDALVGPGRAHLLRLRHRALRRIPHKFSNGFTLLPAVRLHRANALVPRERIDSLPEDHPALITFTSGSTGQPKAAVRSHGFLRAQHRILSRALGLRAGEVDLATLPVFALANLASGLTTLIPDADLRRPGFVDPVPVLRQIDRFGPDRCTASPAFLERLAEAAAARGRPAASFRQLHTGGAPVFPRTLEKLGPFAPNARIHVLYGSTEAEPISEIARDRITEAERAGALRGEGLPVGTPAEGTRVRILRDNGGLPLHPRSAAEFDRLLVPPGQPGEIIVAGDHVLPGYLNGEGDAETKIRIGREVWHRTGDAGTSDREGRLRLLGRCRARVPDPRTPGAWLYPFSIECAATAFPAVRRAAFIRHRERNWLILESEPGAATPDISDFGELAGAIHAVTTLPRIPVDPRHNAKIAYPELRRLLERRLP